MNAQQLETKLQAEGFRSRFQIVVLLKRGPDGVTGEVLSALLERLRNDLGSVLFVVVTGNAQLEEPQLGLTKLLHVEPPLDPEVEDEVMDAILRLENKYFPERIGKSA